MKLSDLMNGKFKDDPLRWARNPRGPWIYPHIIEAAKHHAGVAEILRGHIASGRIKIKEKSEVQAS